jgi:hypothetical protein
LIPTEQLIEAYRETPSVWTVGERLGMSGQSVHKRLKEAGFKMGSPLSQEDRAFIREYYETTPRADFDLVWLASKLGRTKPFVCREAGRMGLTRISAPRSDKTREKAKITHAGKWSRYPHPRGALGMVHTPETKALLSQNSKANWDHFKQTGTGPMSDESRQKKSDVMSVRMNAADPASIYSRAAAGVRSDLGTTYFRSSWEANYARYLNWLQARGEIEKWEYEPDTFWFEKIKRGVRSYKPDFKIWEKGSVYYDEIKGYMDAKSKTKIKRMRIYYPEVKLRVIAAKEYRAIAKTMSAMLPMWESAK